ncbi:alkaline phosphatase family protein [Paenibacillus sp. GCM10023248]|uniref:alkaline phosphatase family protein n=1 Tax=unclassified Paenibacillus TaxID=185978 RepID=UPI00237935EC|nr:alkaline phosphatase family protein [Paenibacillus sp. MAHUQ-63]MDD9266866.1 alkaline phosphatase family protein [Paenibacillus sp. MAHUQ-63]
MTNKKMRPEAGVSSRSDSSYQSIQRVIILGIDGAGAFVREAATPIIDVLLAGGVQTYGAQTVYPSNSGECWGSLLHGVTPERHRSHLHIQHNANYPAGSPVPSLFDMLCTARPGSVMASFVSWKPILTGIIEDVPDISKFSAPDEELVPAVTAYIRTNPGLQLLFVQLDDADAAGHRHGYGSPDHLQAISRADRQIGDISRALLEAGMLEDSLIIVTTDHGGGGLDPFEHGSDDPLDMTIFWGCRGPGIRPAADLTGLSIMDTAAVALHALGLPIPGDWDGKLPEGLLE